MTKLTKNEKILRKASEKWKNFLAEGAFKQVNENNPPKASDGFYIHPKRTPLRVVGGSLKGAEGKAVEFTTSTTGETAVVIELTKDADKKVFGKAGDEVIVLPGDIETIGTDVADDPKMDRFNDMPSRDGELSEARMGEYGKMDAEQGLPPTKIGRGNDEYMAAYNAVLQARGEEPLDIQQPDQAYLDALRSGQLEEGDMTRASWMRQFMQRMGVTPESMDEFMKDNAMYAYRQGMDPKQAAEELQKAASERDFPESGMELYDIDEKKNLKEEVIEDFAIELEDGVTFADVEEAGLVTPGIDSVIDNGDGYAQVYAEPQAMMEMAKTLEAMTGIAVSPQSHGAVDEEMSKKDFVRMVRDKGKVPNLKGDMGPLPGLEGPFQFRSGAVLYYDPKAGAYYDRGKDMYLDREEAARLTMESNPSSFSYRPTHSSDPEMDQVMDIAADMLELSARSRIPVSLVGVESALQKQGFDTEMEKEMLIVDNKYVIAKIEALPKTAQKISFTKYAADYLANLPGEQQDLPLG